MIDIVKTKYSTGITVLLNCMLTVTTADPHPLGSWQPLRLNCYLFAMKLGDSECIRCIGG